MAYLRQSCSLLGLLLLAALLLGAAPARAQFSMFADPKARQVGDIITVLLVERTAAQRASEWNNESNADLYGSGEVASTGGIAGRFAVDANFNKAARNRNRSHQSDLLNGTMTARVTGVDEAGNLTIAGERQLSVNGESHLLRISGAVRPYDVQYNNTVLSYQIADASIVYQRDGIHRRFFKPALLTRIGMVAVLAAGVFIGLQN